MKRVYCLYRVSTKQQVGAEDDIPMQKIACQEFAERNGWIIAKEYLEKGISGFKVSATKRDAVCDLKEAAVKKEFDVLLVYMFDRIGRRDDETPFVVEWFVHQGISVWSTQEGEQRFDNQTDKLMNYIRYWQANGESVKTSIRIKTKLAQMIADGVYTGGATPFGYQLVPSGMVNKKGREIKNIAVKPDEAEYVKKIFSLTTVDGYGSYRVADYLNRLGIKTHNGSSFQCNTVNRILGNHIYCGYFVSGENVSPKQEELAIIDEGVFAEAQNILKQRSTKNQEKSHIARTTKGKTLLSGNVFCGHCGSRLVASTYGDSYTRLDGTTVKSKKYRYICYHNTRGLNDCNGQGAYSAQRIDAAVENMINEYLDRIKCTPKDKALEIRYSKELKEKRRLYEQLAKSKEGQEKEMQCLTAEIGRALGGNSRFTPEVLSMSIENLKQEISATEEKIAEYEREIGNQKEVIKNLDFDYERFVGWANEFEQATMEQKKIIICNLISEINIRRGYEIELKFNISYRQFLNAN